MEPSVKHEPSYRGSRTGHCYVCYTPGMTTIAHRELRNNSSEILRRVAEGETFEVTNHGVVVAQILPVQPSPLAGVSHRPARIRGRFRELVPVTSSQSSQEVLDYLRGEW